MEVPFNLLSYSYHITGVDLDVLYTLSTSALSSEKVRELYKLWGNSLYQASGSVAFHHETFQSRPQEAFSFHVLLGQW
jgi:hypothetical protein